MSIQIIATVLPKRLGSPARKIVALKLADVAHEDGTRIYPSVETIAAQCELSERQVRRVLQEFRTEGLLVVVQMGGGRNRPTHYKFDLDALAKLTEAKPIEEGSTPQPENPVTETVEKQNPDRVSPFKGLNPDTQSINPDRVSPNPSLPLSSSSKKASAPDGAGGEPPSTSSEIWKEGLSLLKTTSFSDKQARTIIGQWCKRAPSEENKKALLAILHAARRAGTGDPVAYITKAVNQAFPPPPDPTAFDDVTWRRNIQAAINMRSWSAAWGPPPGAKVCKVPAAMVTPELIVALQSKRKAA